MKQIGNVKPNGFGLVSTFSGCGGSCLGFKMAGFKVLWANEFVPPAREVYVRNHADVVMDDRDIRKIKPEEILKAIGKKKREIDVLEGSPPCASFSTAGRRNEGWGKVRKYSEVEQRVDDLFFEFCRILKGLKPKIMIAENVSGLVKGVAKGYFLEIKKALGASGYDVQASVLDAKWLGVPQSRQRVIFFGIRKDLSKKFKGGRYPTPKAFTYSIEEAIPWLRKPQNDIHGVEPESDISRYAIGKEWDKLRPGEQSEKYFSLVRTNPKKPCPTVTAEGGQNPGIASVTHPLEKRKFSIAELKRICSFPDDFELTGNYSQRWERLGRSVPPLMMMEVAKCVEKVLLSI